MCNKNSNSPPDLLPTKEKQGKSKSKSKPKSKQSSVISMSGRPSRKIKTRKKKQKFVSLVEIGEKPEFSAEEAGQQHRQLDLFPLHPENLVEEETERENENQYDNVSLLFDGADNENAATLNGLLDAEAATTTTSGEVEESLTYGYSESGTHGDLVRTAMKAKERDASEERWVCYSEVVETKEESVMELEEESICGGGGGDEEEEEEEDGHRGWCSGGGKLLALKLDYQEIMEAWSDKGPLYLKGEGPQTVPNLYDGDQMVGSGMWSVPELMVSGNNEDSLMKNEDWRRGHRLASVLRYKEKRQNRLFAKRIRYEVRKLNAEKRPRMKGRFVKRD